MIFSQFIAKNEEKEDSFPVFNTPITSLPFFGEKELSCLSRLAE